MHQKEIIPFTFNNAHTVTAIVDEQGEPWFVAKEVCSVLGIENAHRSLSYLDADEKSYLPRRSVGLKPGRDMIIINESGLYSLILRSRKPQAKAFRKWVTSEVLPSIRKHGGYMMAQPEETLEELALRAMKVLQATVDRQKEQLALQAPKVEMFDQFLDSTGLVNLRTGSKSLGYGVVKLNKALHRANIFFKDRENDNMPFQRFINMGWFVVKPFLNGVNGRTGTQTFYTTKGITAVGKAIEDGILHL